jgi:hypothetical protein
MSVVHNPALENTTYLPLNSGNTPLYIYILYVYVFSIYVYLISGRKRGELIPSILGATMDSTKYRRGSAGNTFNIFAVQHTHMAPEQGNAEKSLTKTRGTEYLQEVQQRSRFYLSGFSVS